MCYLYSLIPLSSDGKASLKRLQRFFKKEKDRLKVNKINSKENIR